MHLYVPRRLIGAFMAGLVMFSSSLLTISLRNSLESQVDLSARSTPNASTPRCVKSAPLSTRPQTPKDYPYKWSPNSFEIVESSLLWSIMSTHLLGGVLADKYGSRWVVAYGIASCSVLCLLGPLILSQCAGHWQIILVYNILRGLNRGLTYPGIASFLGQWIPDGEKTFVNGWVVIANTLGQKLKEIFVSMLKDEKRHWSNEFYIFGSIGVIVTMLWIWLCYSSPELDKRIRPKEKIFIRRNLGPYLSKKKIPWKEIFSSLPVWGLIFAYAGVANCWMGVYEAIDFFITDGLGYNLKNSYKSAALLVATILNMCVGLLIDILAKKDYVEMATSRKIVANIGAMGSGMFCITAAHVGCYENLVSGITLFAMCIAMFYKTAVYTNPLDLAPNFSGTLTGLGLTTYSLYRGMFFLWAQEMTKENRHQDWRQVLWITFGMCALSNMIFALSCTADEQEWNIPKHLRVQYDVDQDKKVDQAEKKEIEMKHISSF